MKTAPLEAAALTFTPDGLPFSPRYADIYHPRAGALAQARHVFLNGNDLPARWQGRECFVVLETGFGLGNNFLATWQAWRSDPRRSHRLVFVSIESHPLTRDELAQVHADSPLRELADMLQQAWPPRTWNLHTLSFDAGAVTLMLAFGDVQAWLPELIARVDAFFLDGFAPAANPRMWDARVCKALGRLAAPHATLATWSAARALREGLSSAGFEVRRGAGIGGKRDITLARFAPGFTPRRAPARLGAVAEPGRALIVGAGLAGCTAAGALAEQGWQSILIERHDAIASATSGNPAGLFHGIVNAQDGVHARFNRAAALHAQAAVRRAVADHGVAGAISGLLRLERATSVEQMGATLMRLGLPEDYARALPADEAAERAGLALSDPAWFYPGGGWVDPAGLARAWLERAGTRAELHTGIEVHALRHDAQGWSLVDARGTTIAQASTVILANAANALTLLGAPRWPIESLRGQISTMSALPAMPRLPIAGAGYLLPAIDGRAIFGATSQRDDDDPAVRIADHRSNLTQLTSLLGHAVDADPATLQGRTGWRCSAVDRLPVIGAAPDLNAAAQPLAGRLDQPRFVPALPGLFLFTALGSRGITWSALGARVLAAMISGAPLPIESSLVDAIAPARFVSRDARRG